MQDRREHIATDAVASVRAEGLEPGDLVLEILRRWVDGLVDTKQLGDAASALAAGDSVSSLLADSESVAART